VRYLQKGSDYLTRQDYARAILEFKNAADAKPLDAEPYYRLGLTYARMNDPMLAAASFKRATELNPQHQDAQLRLAELLATSAERPLLEDAEQRAWKLLPATSNSADVLTVLGLAEWNLGKKGAAEQHLNEAFRVNPNVNAAVQLARIRLDNHDSQGAEELLRKAVQQQPENADLRVVLGELYTILGKAEEAERELQRALATNPKNVAALNDLAALYVTRGKMGDAETMYERLSALPEKRYLSAHAVFLLQSGQPDRAIREFEALWKKAPGDRVRRTELVGAYLSENRIPEAEKILRESLKTNPSDTEAIFQKGIIALSRGDRNAALGAFNQTLALYPDSGQVHYLMARVHHELGATASYQRELDQALRLNPELLSARIELSARLLAIGSTNGALQLMDSAPPSQRNSLPAVVQRNWALLAADRTAEMRQQVDLALKRSRAPALLVQDATLKFRAREYGAAQQSIEEALRIRPDDLPSMTLLVSTYNVQGKSSQAFDAVRAYATQFPKAGVPHYLMGEMLLAKGKINEARAELEESWRVNAQYVQAALTLANLDVQQERLDEARRLLEQVLAVRPSSAEALLMLGALDEKQQRYSEAANRYRIVVEMDSTNVDALNNLACIMAEKLNQADGALQFADRAEELAPYSGMVKDTVGWVLYRKGLYADAAVRLKQAVALEATPIRQLHLAMVYHRLGEAQRSKAMLRDVLRTARDLPEVREGVELIRP
jgi:tetratricopeptide (TPR) repeat protein